MIKLISNRDRLLALIYDSKFNYCYLFQIFHQKAPGLIYRIFLKNMKALTSMEFSESHHKEKQTFIFVGDSEGNFGGFHTIEEEGEGEIGNLVSIHNDGITKILINKINQSEIYNESISICTLGRDGCMMNISIKIFDKNQVQVLQAHQIPTSRGRLESFFCFNNNDGHILQPKKNDKKHANPDVFSRNKFIVGFEGRKMNIYDISGSMIVSCEIEGSGGKMPKLFKFKAIGNLL
ncbi:hypothetical protein BY996DRAFT_1855320 [Phakopsora pachyrhizi]|nr:hypothetical protein BY996DRAFT_1855320 [Phakopsora pachyrhizi]